MEQRKRKKQSLLRTAPLLVCLIATGVAFFAWRGVDTLIQKIKQGKEPASTVSVQTQAAPTLHSSDKPEPVVTDEHGETVTAEATEPPVPTTTEEPKLEFETVTDDYFKDALFIGDSRTDGLRLFSHPGDATVYCATSMTIFGIMDSNISVDGCSGIRSLLKNRSYKKIYIMFGINEAGYNTQSFLDRYKAVLDEIRGYQPDAIIYVQAIMYVTAKKMANQPVFDNNEIRRKNAGLKEFENGEDLFYLEVNEPFDDGNGNLGSEYSGDGAHLKSEYYGLWHDYLLTHAIVKPGYYEPETEPTTEPTTETTVPLPSINKPGA